MVKGSKERSSTIAQNINELGGKAQVLYDSLVIYPITAFNGCTKVRSYMDPRIVMAMALASLKCTKSLTIEDSECVEMTVPSFFEKFSNILA